MERRFDANSLVALPRLGALGMVSLGEALVTQAKAEAALDESVVDSARALRRALVVLRSAMQGRLSQDANEESRREAHREAGRSWRAMRHFLIAWSELSANRAREERELAERCQDGLFSEGLAFLRLPYTESWAAADARLRWLEQHGLTDAFETLGGGEFLADVRTAHKALGRVLSIKKPRRVTDTVPVRASMDAFEGRLREYVVQVVAMSAGGGHAAERAIRLLLPLTDIPVRTARDPSPAEITRDSGPIAEAPAEPAEPAEPTEPDAPEPGREPATPEGAPEIAPEPPAAPDAATPEPPSD